MNKYYQIYESVRKLYNSKKYKDVINAVDRYLKLEFINENYIHNMRFLRAKSLRYLGRFDEAILEFKELLKFDNDNLYSMFDLFLIYYYLNRYNEALDLLPSLYETNEKYISNHSLLIMELVMKTQLGIPFNYKKASRSDYIKEQIVNYNSEKALEHIKSHKYEDYSKNIHSRFNENVDIEYLIECVKNNLNNKEKRNHLDAMEIHYFSVFGIGYEGDNICNYLNVVVCPNTKNIITMYPFSRIEKDDVKVLDCDMDKLFKREEKEKIVSRIDKFNKRFNLK